MAKFKRIKKVYAMIDGIPTQNINLADVITKREEDLFSTIACPGTWISLHPKFKDLTIQEEIFHWGPNNILRYKGEETDFYGGLAKFFDIPLCDAEELFCPKGASVFDSTINRNHGFQVSDKFLWQHRVKMFLRENGEL